MDPPYNQHPYGSNYFMLNLLVDYAKPDEYSEVSGIPKGWNRSAYNTKKSALPALLDLAENLPAKFLLVSFSDDGFLDPAELASQLSAVGKCDVFDNEYNTYRASRNLRDRSLKVTEHLFLVDKG
jgi:adenine-specific DNA-methyltransferase